tara:strand:- start:3159 stop:4238 length:1080 start_codon:yes stop_codon:yes gene_type:complete
MGKHKILFASSLKPTFDIRTEKLYQSFCNDSSYTCHFCGVHSQNNKKKLNTHSWKYNRGLWFRLIINIKYLLLLLRIRPQTIILNNNDLALVSIFYKVLFSTKIIYDVQENLVRNIAYQNVYTGFRKKLYILLIKITNKSLAQYCTGFLLAEKCYADELLFIKKKNYLILENKFLPQKIKRDKQSLTSPIQLLFSGTITRTSGIENALVYLDKLNKITPCHLTIIGHTPDKILHNKLKLLTHPYILYKGETSPLSYHRINEAIIQSDFGLICYEITEANKNKIPTKIYEYLANQLPIICQKHAIWNEMITKNSGGIIFSSKLKHSTLQQKFYSDKNTHFALWDDNIFTAWFKNFVLNKK